MDGAHDLDVADEARSVFAADVDGDGDVDVLSASGYDDEIAWYENEEGDGTSWTARTIASAADGARSVFAADVDGDGDIDVLSASSGDDEIAWYENVLGDGMSWTRTPSRRSPTGRFRCSRRMWTATATWTCCPRR